MKVTVRARPVVYFEITRGDLEILKRCAKLHYDGAVQRQLDRAGAPMGNLTIKASTNGLLTMWSFRFLTENDAEVQEVSCTFDEADLLTKTTEQWAVDQYEGEDARRVGELRALFSKICGLCNKAHATWRLEVVL